ncbi:MAG: hypothetical protein ACREQ5_14210, partial [Candidatus Dormibacteria bacterium]
GEPETPLSQTPPDPPYMRAIPADSRYPVAEFSRAALAHVGLAAPMVHPDQAVLFRIESSAGTAP